MIRPFVISLATLVTYLFGSVFVYANQDWSIEDTQEYFKGLPLGKQKEFIGTIIAKLHEDLPIQIDPYSKWAGIFYLPSSNTITRVFLADVQYNSLDERDVEQFSLDTKKYMVNSSCSKVMFKMFMFETDTIMRVEYDYVSGQRLFSWSIDKNDCLEAGYNYGQN